MPSATWMRSVITTTSAWRWAAVLASHARLSAQLRGACRRRAPAARPRSICASATSPTWAIAEAVDCPVILIADIDRGGVFAHLVGTLALLSDSERARVQGFVINRFRGDLALLQSGLDWLERETGKPVLGVLPYLHGLAAGGRGCVAARAGGQAGCRLAGGGAGAAADQQSHRFRRAARASGGGSALRRPGRRPCRRAT